MSFVGFAESYMDVMKKREELPPELQQAATKQNGIKYLDLTIIKMLLK